MKESYSEKEPIYRLLTATRKLMRVADGDFQSVEALFGELRTLKHSINSHFRWANVGANRGTSKATLVDRWRTQMYDGGPPSLPSREGLEDFPQHAPVEWLQWKRIHMEWQTAVHEQPHRKGLHQDRQFWCLDLPRTKEQSHEGLYGNVRWLANEDEGPREAAASAPSSTFADANCPHNPSNSRANEELNPETPTGQTSGKTNTSTCTTWLPLNRVARRAKVQLEHTAHVVLWVFWTLLTPSAQASSFATTTIQDWFPSGSPVHAVIRALLDECAQFGWAGAHISMHQHKVPFPMPIHQVVKALPRAQFLTQEKAPHTRTISRIKALEEFVGVAHGTCTVSTLDILRHTEDMPEKTFVRVERPQERYFVTGSVFESVAQSMQDLFDKPRNAKDILMSLESLPVRRLLQQTRRLVSEATNGSNVDWINRPTWLPPEFEWTSPEHMTKTNLLELSHMCLEQIFSPNYCGPVQFANGRVEFLAH
ncbi:hypothetical protein AaE_010450 [Aphanomyces astaci]|uniref:Uncharacterized protein n=1 Tax=Aphanomyces astaci TaxID=112090 RepID=A0A6A4ZZX8_APHAT|nr:hypothetical protein AaE_010450 [Aphanomyces astaci]